LFFQTEKEKQKAIVDGNTAEAYALDYLQSQQLIFVTNNYRCRGGEIDLIMLDNADLVFIEVKFRSSIGYGRAAEMVSASKQQKIIHCAELFLSKHQKYSNAICRFDVFAIEGNPQSIDQALSINWIKNAFLS
jgi:putative endonuclease